MKMTGRVNIEKVLLLGGLMSLLVAGVLPWFMEATAEGGVVLFVWGSASSFMGQPSEVCSFVWVGFDHNCSMVPKGYWLGRAACASWLGGIACDAAAVLRFFLMPDRSRSQLLIARTGLVVVALCSFLVARPDVGPGLSLRPAVGLAFLVLALIPTGVVPALSLQARRRRIGPPGAGEPTPGPSAKASRM